MIKKYWQLVLLILNFVILIGVCAFICYEHFYKNKENEDIVIEENFEVVPQETKNQEKFYIDLKGAVKNPGVYEVNDKTIINDVIKMAGGFNSNAYTKNINLSKRLKNETVIYVYSQYEYSLLDKKEEVVETCVCPEPELSVCIESGSSVIENKNENEDNSNTEDLKNDDTLNIEDLTHNDAMEITKININTASKEELMKLNGIGEAKAKSIIEYRIENGNFLSCEDIKRVSGISDSLYEKIKNDITV